jgi:hypothetical protein
MLSVCSGTIIFNNDRLDGEKLRKDDDVQNGTRNFRYIKN